MCQQTEGVCVKPFEVTRVLLFFPEVFDSLHREKMRQKPLDKLLPVHIYSALSNMVPVV